MGAPNNENNPDVININLGTLAAAAVVPGAYLKKRFMVTGVHLINGATVAASDTDYAQVSLKKGSTVIAELDTRAAHENGLTTLVGKALNLVAAEVDCAAGTSLSVEYAEGGTMTLTLAQLCVSGYWI
jgi:hypothetical protein